MIIELGFWAWFIAAAVLILLEVSMPIYYFLWLGTTAAVVGVIAWLFPGLDITWQLALFSGLSIISVILGRAYIKKGTGEEQEATLNRRAEQYMGRVLVLDEPIVNGESKLKVDGLFWKVRGTDCPAGTSVRVVSIHQRSILMVEIEPKA